MNAHIITLFPEVIDAYAQASILGRAQKEKLLTVKSYQLRDFVAKPAGARTGAWFYQRVDDKPYGGGPGMVLQAEPVIRAVEAIQKKIAKTTPRKSKSVSLIYQTKKKKAGRPTKVIFTSPGGKPLTNAYAKKLAKERMVVIVCGRYEGIDARAKKMLKASGYSVDEVSTGPYILTGGEVPALAIIDAAARQIPGVLGKQESLEESRVASHEVYTRPETIKYKGKSYRVPKILLSGHRAKIDEWKLKKGNVIRKK